MMMIIDYLLLMGLVVALLVAGYAAVIRRLHTPVHTNPDERPSNAVRITRTAIPSLVARGHMGAGIVGRRSRNRLITAARLSSFARKPILRRRNRGS
jgi:hypothetical protein